MAIVSGVVCVAAGLARLGFITELLSKPIRYGYMNGIALTVLLSQIPKLFGFSVDATGPLRQAWASSSRCWRDSTNVVALAIGAGTLALILLLKRWPRVPGILIAVVGATVVVGVFDLGDTRGRVGARSSAAGAARRHAFRSIATSTTWCRSSSGGVAVALVSFADTSVLSRTYAARLRTPVDPNQEMVGLGAGQPRRRLLSGLPDQQQLVAHAGGRGGGRAGPS